MDFSIKWHNNIAERTFYNTLTDRVAIDSRNSMRLLSNNKLMPKQLLNFLQLKEIKLSSGFMQKIAEEDCSLANGQKIYFAVITKMPSMFGLLRQYQMYSDRSNLHMHIFDDYEAGLSWLKQPEQINNLSA